MDVVDNIWISATAKNFVYSKAHMLIAPNSAGSVTKFDKNSSGDEIANVNLLRQHRTCRPRDQRLRPFNEFVISI